MLDTGYWILDTGCWMLDAGYYILNTRHELLVTGYLHLDACDCEDLNLVGAPVSNQLASRI